MSAAPSTRATTRFCLTVDTDSYSRRERDIAKRHQRRRVRVDDARIYQAQFNWRDVERIKQGFDIPLILKGIATAEDAKIAVEHGVDCVYVSNHGGRQLDQGVGSIDVLPEVVEAVGGRARIIVDGCDQPRHRRRQGADPRRRRGRLSAGSTSMGSPPPAQRAWCGSSRSSRTRSASASRCSASPATHELDKSYIRAGPPGRAAARPQRLPASRPAEGNLLSPALTRARSCAGHPRLFLTGCAFQDVGGRNRSATGAYDTQARRQPGGSLLWGAGVASRAAVFIPSWPESCGARA